MEQKAHELLQQLHEAGHDRNAIYNELISQGYSTEGFEEAYRAVAGSDAVHTDAAEAEATTAPTQDSIERQLERYHQSRNTVDMAVLRRNIIKIVGGGIVITGLLIIATTYWSDARTFIFGERESDSELSAEDVVTQANLASMQRSANRYRSRMLDYGGVCRSIGIDRAKYTCTESRDAYAIEGQLSDGRYYCVDSTGFAGVQARSRDGNTACAQ